MSAHVLLVGYVVFARLAELLLARRNTRRLLAKGGYEVGRGHYPLIVATHAAWILAVAFLVPTDTSPKVYYLIPFIMLQVVRYWVILSLGDHWTTRVIVLPGAALVTHGPYRWLKHPNYLVVIGEIALLPLVFGAWKVALGFTVVNTAIIFYRIRIEETALEIGIDK